MVRDGEREKGMVRVTLERAMRSRPNSEADALLDSTLSKKLYEAGFWTWDSCYRSALTDEGFWALVALRR